MASLVPIASTVVAKYHLTTSLVETRLNPNIIAMLHVLLCI